jgi:hypothetical protein
MAPRRAKGFNVGIIALIVNVVVLAVVSLATRHLASRERSPGVSHAQARR